MGWHSDIIINCFERKGIEFTELSETEDYKIEWVNRFAPAGQRDKALKHCLDNEFWGGGYLWHIFSWEILNPCFVERQARIKYDVLYKCEAILIDGIDNTAYKITDSSLLASEDFDAMTDIVITDIDFCWTYAKTHEGNCGPYFYNI